MVLSLSLVEVLLQFIIPLDGLRVEGMFSLISVNPVAFLPGATPFDTFSGAAPLMRTIRLAHRCSNHFQWLVLPFRWYRGIPLRRDDVMPLEFVVRVCPSKFGVVMHEDAGIP